MAERKKGARDSAPAPRLPDRTGDVLFHELSRDAFSVFLYLTLSPDGSRELVKRLGLALSGFRTESLGDAERCDLIADEVREHPEKRGPVVDALRAVLGELPLALLPIDPDRAQDVLELGGSDQGLLLALWRVMADPDPGVRVKATPVLDQLVATYYGIESAEQPLEDAAPFQEPQERAIPELERELAQAQKELKGARQKFEAQREKLHAQIKEARTREAQALDEAARMREAYEVAQRAQSRAEAALAAAQETEVAAEAHRAKALAHDLEGKLASADAKLERERERTKALESELTLAKRVREAPAATPVPAQAPGNESIEEEASSTWSLPVFTREFYDSLEGWDRRIQRAAFKQANLLALDHRHPSLRALPLEGLPGYYRVRVATDVRLLYRRSEKQNGIEILSLIDREDLDRYIKQAKTRG